MALALERCVIQPQNSLQDVLILKQFLRRDGTLLPRRVTGVCASQQLKLSRLVHLAHEAGLFSFMGSYLKSGSRTLTLCTCISLFTFYEKL